MTESTVQRGFSPTERNIPTPAEPAEGEGFFPDVFAREWLIQWFRTTPDQHEPEHTRKHRARILRRLETEKALAWSDAVWLRSEIERLSHRSADFSWTSSRWRKCEARMIATIDYMVERRDPYSVEVLALDVKVGDIVQAAGLEWRVVTLVTADVAKGWVRWSYSGGTSVVLDTETRVRRLNP